MYIEANKAAKQQQQIGAVYNQQAIPNQWRVISATKYTPQRPTKKKQERLMPNAQPSQNSYHQRERSYTHVQNSAQALTASFPQRQTVRERLSNSFQQIVRVAATQQDLVNLNQAAFAHPVYQSLTSSVGAWTNTLLPTKTDDVHNLAHDGRLTFSSGDQVQSFGSGMAYVNPKKSHKFSSRDRQQLQGGSPPVCNRDSRVPQPWKRTYIGTGSEDELDYLNAEENEDDREYSNRALVDFPSDADIVSFEQTPRRHGENLFVASSQEEPTEGLGAFSGSEAGRFQSQSGSLVGEERAAHRQKTKQMNDQVRSPMLRCLSLIKAFHNKLASGNQEASASLTSSQQTSTDKKQGAEVGKVQLTEPNVGKRDADPFGKTLQSHTVFQNDKRMKEDVENLNGQKFHYRTPPPGPSKKNQFVLGQHASTSPNICDGPLIKNKAGVGEPRNSQLKGLNVRLERSPHFLDGSANSLQLTQNECQLMARKYSVYRKARESMLPNHTMQVHNLRCLKSNLSKSVVRDGDPRTLEFSNASQTLENARQSQKQQLGRAESHKELSNQVLVLRRSVELLSDQLCSLRAELACGENVIQSLMRKNRELKQAMLLQSEMISQKELVACHLRQVAVENFELRQQNARLWTVIGRQRNALFTAQEELDEDRAESESLLEELACENKSLRDLLRISDRFSGETIQKQLNDCLKQAEAQVGHVLGQTGSDAGQLELSVKQMVTQAADQIKQLAVKRKLEREREAKESHDESAALPVNGKRTIQPKRAFLLAEEASESDSDGDEELACASEEERRLRKEAQRKRREQQMILDQMDGVPLKNNKQVTIFNLDSAF